MQLQHFTLFCLLRLLAGSLARRQPPRPDGDRYDSSMVILNKYIPEHASYEADNTMRLTSLDCSDDFVSSREIIQFVQTVTPDIAVFIKFPRSSYDFDTCESAFTGMKYNVRWLEKEYMIISKFPILSEERLRKPGDDNELFALDVRLEINKKAFHVLPIRFNRFDKAIRTGQTMEVLYRAGAIMSKQESFVIAGSTGSKKEEDESWKTLRNHALVKDSFDAVGWSQPRFTDPFGHPSDHILVARGLSPHVLGSYPFYTGITQHLPIITDISLEPFGLVPAKVVYTWESFSDDLYNLMLYWVPLVAIGVIIVLILGFILRRIESTRNNSRNQLTLSKASNTALAAGEIVPVMQEADQTVWDVIDVSPEQSVNGDEPRKERMASFDSTNSSHSSHGSNLYPPPPPQAHVVRIQTPPQYPPPPYSASDEEKKV